MIKKSIQDLLKLQTIDLRIRNLEIRLQTIPGERAKLVEEFEIEKKALADAKTRVLQTEQLIKKIQAQIVTEQENLQSLLIKSANTKKASEYQAVMDALENLKKRISDLETREITAWDDLETQKNNAVKAEKHYKSIGRQVQTEVIALDKLKEKILLEIREKQALSLQAEKNVAMNILSQYKRFLASKKGEPLSAISSMGHCVNCGLKLPPQTINLAAKGDMVSCDNCTYFLYDPNAKQN